MSNAGASLATCYGPVSAQMMAKAENIRLLILDHAAVYRYDTMGTGLVYPRKNAAVSSRAKGRLHLVAIMQRIVHADNWADIVKTA